MSAKGAKIPKALSESVAREIYAADYIRGGLSLSQCAQKHGVGWYQIFSAFRRHGLPRRKPCCGRKRISADYIAEMHADYMRPMSLAAVGRKYKRDRRSVRELFENRGLEVRPCEFTNPRGKDGKILPFVPKTEAELERIIASLSKLKIPDELKLEWRHWSIEKRGAFIARARAKLRSPNDIPDAPFSNNVVPFDYATPAARAIQARLNAGLSSRDAVCKIDVCSQGVIYGGELWFWSPGTGYQKQGKYYKNGCRPLLNRVIWKSANGRPVPAKHIVYFKDGNPNNLAPDNLGLMSMNENARRNQSAALFRKSRERTSLLLQRAQKKGKTDGLIESLRKAA